MNVLLNLIRDYSAANFPEVEVRTLRTSSAAGYGVRRAYCVRLAGGHWAPPGLCVQAARINPGHKLSSQPERDARSFRINSSRALRRVLRNVCMH